MANIFERLFSRQRQLEQISSQLQDMQSNYGALQQQNSILQQQLAINFRAQGGFTKYDYNNQIGYIKQGYNISSAIYAIVSDIASKAAQIPLKVYEVKDDSKLKNYKHLMSNPTHENIFKAQHLRTKALDEVPENDKLQMLIDNPNPFDDPIYFYTMFAGFRLLTGNSYLWTPTLDMGADKGLPGEMYILPSQFTAIITTNAFPKRILGYELIIDGVRLVQSEEVLHLKYPNYDFSMDGQELYGLSPLQAAAKTTRRANFSEDSAVSQLTNGGPGAIVANKSISSDEIGLEQAGKMQQHWQSNYGGPNNRNKIKLMAGDINVIPLGLSPVELALIEGEKWTFDMLCNVYKYSSVMFNNHDGNTESNVQEMRKDSYTRAVLPERIAQRDAFNRKIVPLFSKKKKYFVDLDISGIAELQPDMSTMAKWLSISFWISPNEKRKMQDFDEDTDPNMDKFWIPNNLMLLENAALPPQQPAKPGDATGDSNKPTSDENNTDTNAGE
jgi:HK97 family phage portal protein